MLMKIILWLFSFIKTIKTCKTIYFVVISERCVKRRSAISQKVGHRGKELNFRDIKFFIGNVN